jgi:hypothetical protein
MNLAIRMSAPVGVVDRADQQREAASFDLAGVRE